MLFVAKKVLRVSYGFATARGKATNNIQTHKIIQIWKKMFSKFIVSREEVFRKSQLKGDWEVEEAKNKRQLNQLEKMLSVDKDKILSNASQIQARAIKNRNIFDENSEKSLLSSYGNYKPYDKVHPIINDRNLVQGQFLEKTHLTQNLYQFIEKLPDDYEEKEEIKKIMSKFPANKQGMTLTQYGKLFQKQMNDAQRSAFNKYQNFKVHHEQKFTQKEIPQSQRTDIRRNWFEVDESITYNYTGIQKTVDPFTGGDDIQATLSPKAVDTIYDLYLQGWNVREISKRFGILPARTKFCVWVRAQLYHEVIPKLGVKYYLRGLRFEQKYNQYQNFCDYGLDLDQLSNNSILEEITQWNGQMLDAQRGEQKYQGAMMRLQKQRIFNRYVMLEVGTIGQENGRYKLKQWVIFRGKGSDQYFLRNQLLNPLTWAQKKFNKVYY